MCSIRCITYIVKRTKETVAEAGDKIRAEGPAIYPTAGLAADYKKGCIHYVQTYSIYKR